MSVAPSVGRGDGSFCRSLRRRILEGRGRGFGDYFTWMFEEGRGYLGGSDEKPSGDRGGSFVQPSVEDEGIKRRIGIDQSDVGLLGRCRFENKKGLESRCEEKRGSLKCLRR